MGQALLKRESNLPWTVPKVQPLENKRGRLNPNDQILALRWKKFDLSKRILNLLIREAKTFLDYG